MSGSIKIASSNGYGLVNAQLQDLIIYTTSNINQRILFGTSNYAPMIVNSNNVAISGDMNVSGTLYRPNANIQYTTLNNTGTEGEWRSLGLWTCCNAGSEIVGAKLKITILGGKDWRNVSGIPGGGGETNIYAIRTSDSDATRACIMGTWQHSGGDVPLTRVRFVQNGTNRAEHYVYAYMRSFSQHATRVETTGGSLFTQQFALLGTASNSIGAANTISSTQYEAIPIYTNINGIITTSGLAVSGVMSATPSNPSITSTAGGGPIFKQSTWDASANSHTITINDLVGSSGDNFSGNLFIMSTNKYNNSGTIVCGVAQLNILKRVSGSLTVNTNFNSYDGSGATITIAPSGNTIVVSTPSTPFSISWTFIGAY